MEQKEPNDGKAYFWVLAVIVFLALAFWVKGLFVVAGNVVARLVAGIPFLLYALTHYTEASKNLPKELETEPGTGRIVIPWNTLIDIEEKYSPTVTRYWALTLLIPATTTALFAAAIALAPEVARDPFYAIYPLFALPAEMSGAAHSCLVFLDSGDKDVRLSAFVINTAISFVSGLLWVLCILADLDSLARINYLKRAKNIHKYQKSRSILHMTWLMFVFVLFSSLMIFMIFQNILDESYCFNQEILFEDKNLYEHFIILAFFVYCSGWSISATFGCALLYMTIYRKYCLKFSYKDFVIT